MKPRHAAVLVVFAAVVVAPWAVAQEGPELLPGLPSDVLAYARLTDGARLAERFEEGPFGRVLDRPELRPLADLLRHLFHPVLEDAEELASAAFDTSIAELLGLFRGPVEVAVLPPTTPDEPAWFAFGLDAGPAGARLRTVLEFLERQAAGEGRAPGVLGLWRAGEHRLDGTRLVFASRKGVLEGLLAAGEDRLRESESYRDGTRRTGGEDADVFVHVDLARLFPLLTAGWSDRQRRDIEGLELESFRSVALAVRATGDGYEARCHVAAPLEEGGLAALLDPGTIPAGFDPRVPADAVDASAGRLDLAGIWKRLVELLPAGERESFGSALARFEERSGVEIEDFLGRFGPAWSGYSVAPPLGGVHLDTIYRLGLDRAVGVLDDLQRLAEATGGFEARAFEAGGRSMLSIVPRFGRRDDEEAVLFELAGILGLPHCFAVDGDVLVAASSGQALQRVFLRDPAAFRPHPRFGPVEAKATWGQRAWIDQGRSLGSLYEISIRGLRALDPWVRRWLRLDPAFHPDLLPPAEAFAGDLPEGEIVVSATDAGVLVEVRSLVFPGGSSSLALGALGVGATVPALVSRRARAEAMRCTANLKQIGLGVALYQQKNNDFMPAWGNPDFFETLRSDTLADPHVYLCPEGTPAEALEFGIDAIDYRTWSGGKKLTSGQIAKYGSRVPVAWDRNADRHGGMRRVLFGDGHVEEVEEAAFQEMLDKWSEELGLVR